MSSIGAFTFVLHSHLPYARMAGRWPHGEEWIHEAASETYIPLLNALHDLKEKGTDFHLTIGLTPILVEQLADLDVLRNFSLYLDEKIEAAEKDILRFENPQAYLLAQEGDLKTEATVDELPADPEADDDEKDEEAAVAKAPEQDVRSKLEKTLQTDLHMAYLAKWYRDWFQHIKDSFEQRYSGDMVQAFRRLQDDGYIEIITCGATHGYLPLLGRDSAVYAQVKVGVEAYKRHFGCAPRAMWLPECAYRPAYLTNNGKLRPGIEHFLQQNGIKLFFSETHTIEGGVPVGVAAGDAIGPYGEIKRRYVIPIQQQIAPRSTTTYRPYYVSDTASGQQPEQHSSVSVIGRDNRTGMQVWSAEWGYPGDFDYREFHKKDAVSGLQYWRVTGSKVSLGDKDAYHPDWAEHKVSEHARHFAELVADRIREQSEATSDYGLVASNYDTELFGHWWFEGVEWIKQVLQHLSADPQVELTSASDFLAKHPPNQVLHIPEGSWGAGGTHWTWDNHDTHWMWKPIHRAEARMEALANKYSQSPPSEDELAVLKQAARELLLLESSDWPFLVTTGQAKEYAIQRFTRHVDRFDALATSIEQGQPDRQLADEMYEVDKIYPHIDFRWYAQRE